MIDGSRRQETGPDLTRPLVTHLATLTIDDLPAPAVVGARAALLDHIACLTYGMDQPWLRSVRDALLDPSSQGPSRVFGTRMSTTPSDAAFVNGTAAHGFELDDIYYRTHPGSVVISAALASVGKYPTTGPGLLAAIAVGYELIGRVARSIGSAHSQHGFHTMGVVGPFGSAAATAHARGLDPEAFHAAVGIAASFGSGIKAFIHGPGMVKRLHAGHAARNGVLAVELAAAGFAGPDRPLEGRFGFMRVFAPHDAVPEALSDGLGEDYAVSDVYLKPYSACGALHGVIRAAEQIRSEHRVDLADVQSIAIGTTAHGMQKSQPRPVDVMTTQYSLQSAAVLGLMGRAGDPLSFRPDVVLNGEAGRVMGAISIGVDDEAEAHFPEALDSRVTVTLRDGTERSAYGVGHAQGSRNLSPDQRWEAAVAKFHRLAQDRVDQPTREAVVDEIGRLAQARSVDRLLSLLA